MSGITRRKQTGEAWETVPDTDTGGTATGVETPDVGPTETADSITIKAGDSVGSTSGRGGNVTIQAGQGDTEGVVTLRDATSQVELQLPTGGHVRAVDLGDGHFLFDADAAANIMGIQNDPAGQISFFNAPAGAQQTVTGALSAVTDAAAKDVLTSIVALLAAYGLGVDGTT